jgi:hypothetical protein
VSEAVNFATDVVAMTKPVCTVTITCIRADRFLGALNCTAFITGMVTLEQDRQFKK